MLLYIIRHGDPIYDPDSLTEKGKQQAQALARRLSVHGLDELYASPLIRARQTAQPTCDLLGIEAKIEEWTSENLAWADLSGPFREDGSHCWAFHVPSVRYKTPEMLALGERWYEAEPFCRTNAKAGYERIQRESDDFLARLGYHREGLLYRAERPNEKRVAVFCHQGFGTTWLSHLLMVSPPLFWASFDMNHSSVTILHFGEPTEGLVAPKCIALSDTSHLYADRLPLQFCNELDI